MNKCDGDHGLPVCDDPNCWQKCPTCAQSVLQNWVMKLPLRAQGTILTAIRGCDLTPKFPLDSPERHLSAWIRWCVLNPADPREVGITGAWFQDRPPIFKPSALGHYPLHWIMHIVHTLEIISSFHPNEIVATQAFDIYVRLVKSFHLNIEERDQLMERLTEDRIANNSVVS